MEIVKWKLRNGKWEMKNEEWEMQNGKWEKGNEKGQIKSQGLRALFHEEPNGLTTTKSQVKGK